MGVRAAELEAIITADDRQYQKTLDGAEARIRSFSSNMQSLGRDLSLAITAPIAAAFVLATKEFVGFDEQMRNVNSIAKQSEAVFNSMSQEVLDLSVEYGKSASDLASGLYDINSSGYLAADAVTVLAAATEAATAGVSNVADTAKGLTAVMNTYRLDASQAAYVSDVLFQSVNLGIYSFGQLATSIGNVTGTASTAGISIEEMAAGVANISRATNDAAEATVSLNQVLVQLISPSKDAQKAAAAMGLSWLANNQGAKHLKAVGLHKTMEEIARATGGAVDQMYRLFPEIRSARGAMELARDSAKTFGADLAAMNNAGGSTMAALTEQSKSLAFQMNQLVADFKAGGIETVNAWQDTGAVVVGVIKSIVDAYREMPAETKKWISGTLLIIAAIGPLLFIVGSLAGSLTNIITLVGEWRLATAAISAVFSNTMASISSWIYSTITGLYGAATAGEAFGAVLTVLTGPIGWVIAALVALFIAFQTNFGGARDQINALWDNIKSFAGEAVSTLANMGAAIWSVVMEIVKSFQLWWRSNDATVQGLKRAWAFLVEIAKTLVTTLIQAFVFLWTTLKMVWRVGADTVIMVFRMLAAALRGDWQGVGQALVDGSKKIWAALVQWFYSGASAILKIVRKLGDSIAALLGTQFSVLDNTIAGLDDKASEWDKKYSKMASGGANFKIKFTMPKLPSLSLPDITGAKMPALPQLPDFTGSTGSSGSGSKGAGKKTKEMSEEMKAAHSAAESLRGAIASLRKDIDLTGDTTALAAMKWEVTEGQYKAAPFYLKQMALGYAANKDEIIKATNAQRDADALTKLAGDKTAELSRQLALAGDSSEVAALKYDLSSGSLAKLDQATKDSILSLAQRVSAEQAAAAQTQSLQQAAKSQIADLTKTIALNGDESEITALKYELSSGSLAGLDTATKNHILTLANEADALARARDEQAKKTQAQADATAAIQGLLADQGAQLSKLRGEYTTADDIIRSLNIDVKNLSADALKALEQAITNATDIGKIERLRDAIKDVADNLRDTFSDAFHDLFDNGVKGFFSKVVSGVQGMLADIAAEFLANQVIWYLLGRLGGTDMQQMWGGRRATGGSVAASSTYLVGERGPELFTPRNDGFIVPNSQLGAAGGGGATTVINHFEFNIATPDVAGFKSTQSQLMAEAARRAEQVMRRDG